MIEKVTLQLSGDADFTSEGGPRCEEMNPKTLLLYAAAKCVGKTALMIMDKERFRPKRFEIGISGELSDETPLQIVPRSLQHRMRHRGRPGQSEPCGDAGARKVLRHDADAAQGRTRIARNRGGQHRACESLKRQARDTKNGDFHLKSPFFVPRRQETGGGVPKRRSRPCGFRSRNRHPRRDGLPGKACLPPLTAP